MGFASTLGASIPVFQKLEPATVSPLTVLGLSVLVVVALLVIFFGPELWRRAPRPTNGTKLQALPIRNARELGRRTARPSA
jgi:hypothetical protein